MHTSSTICVDASCIVRLLADPDDREIQRRWTEWQSDRRSLVAPRLLRYEVTNALYRYQRSGQRSDMTVRSALRTAMDLPITLYDEMDLHDRALAWAIRLSFRPPLVPTTWLSPIDSVPNSRPRTGAWSTRRAAR